MTPLHVFYENACWRTEKNFETLERVLVTIERQKKHSNFLLDIQQKAASTTEKSSDRMSEATKDID